MRTESGHILWIFVALFCIATSAIVSADPMQDLHDSLSLGVEIGSGYSWGHLQEVIYPSDPLDGLDLGLGLWMALRPLSLGPAGIGARFTIEYHAIPIDGVFISLFNLHADLQADVQFSDYVLLYGFGGVSIAGTSFLYQDSDEPVTEEGKGFRYGAGARIRVIDQPMFELRMGPELSIHHIIYQYVIYHYSRILLSLEVAFK